MLLRALGYSTEELLNYYYDTETIYLEPNKKYAKSVEYDLLPGQRATRDISHPDTARSWSRRTASSPSWPSRS